MLNCKQINEKINCLTVEHDSTDDSGRGVSDSATVKYFFSNIRVGHYKKK